MKKPPVPAATVSPVLIASIRRAGSSPAMRYSQMVSGKAKATTTTVARRSSHGEIGRKRATVALARSRRTLRHITVCGNARFWRLVGALADAVVTAGTLRWRQARSVLQATDRQQLERV
jgi:hypothetical protein